VRQWVRDTYPFPLRDPPPRVVSLLLAPAPPLSRLPSLFLTPLTLLQAHLLLPLPHGVPRLSNVMAPRLPRLHPAPPAPSWFPTGTYTFATPLRRLPHSNVASSPFASDAYGWPAYRVETMGLVVVRPGRASSRRHTSHIGLLPLVSGFAPPRPNNACEHDGARVATTSNTSRVGLFSPVSISASAKAWVPEGAASCRRVPRGVAMR
jgi:hypothetical protein